MSINGATEVTGEHVNPLLGQANDEACAQGEAHAAAPVQTANGKSRRASLVIAETHELLHGLGEDAARSKALMEELEKLLAGSRSCASSSGRSEHGGAGAGAEGDGPAKPHCHVVEAQNFKSVEPIQIDTDDDSDTDEQHPFSPQPPRTPATPSGRRHSVTFEAPTAHSGGRRSSVVMLDGTALMPVGGSSLRASSTNTPFVVALGAAPAPPASLRSSVSFTNRRASSLVATTAQAAHILGGRSYNDLRSSRRRSSTDAPGPLPHLLAALPALSGTSSGPGYAHSNASSRRATGQGDAADSPGASPAAPGPGTGVSAMRSRSFRNNLLQSCSLQPPSYSSGQLSIAESRSTLDGDAPPAPHLHSHPPPAGLYPAMHLDEAEEDAEAEAEAEAEAQAAACRGATADGGYARSPSGLQRSSSSKSTGRFMRMLKGIFVPAASASQPSSGEASRRAEPLARASTLDAAGLAERSQPSAGALSSMTPLARRPSMPSMRRPTTTSHGQLQGPLPGASPRSFTAARSNTASGSGGILGSELRMEQVMRAAAAVAGMGPLGVRAGSLSAAQVPQVAAAVAGFTSAAAAGRGPTTPNSSTQHGWVGEAYGSNGGLNRSTSRRASSTFVNVGALPHL